MAWTSAQLSRPLQPNEPQHVNRHGPATTEGGFAAGVGDPVIFTLNLMDERAATHILIAALCATHAVVFAAFWWVGLSGGVSPVLLQVLYWTWLLWLVPFLADRRSFPLILWGVPFVGVVAWLYVSPGMLLVLALLLGGRT